MNNEKANHFGWSERIGTLGQAERYSCAHDSRRELKGNRTTFRINWRERGRPTSRRRRLAAGLIAPPGVWFETVHLDWTQRRGGGENASSTSGRNQKLMDFTTGILLPLLLGGAGIFTLFRWIRRIQARAYLKDAVVVITGATSGLGKECAKAFHAAGSKLVLCGRSGERLQEVLQELSVAADPLKNAHRHHTVVFDLSDTKAVVNAAKEILNCVDHVDILINNAGISYRGTVADTAIEVDRKVMETNYFGPVALTKALLPAMMERRKGHIVAISSVQGKISVPFRSAYAASKHATQAFFDCLRAEVARFNLEVTVVCPGYIQTNLSLNAVTSDGSQYGVMDKTTSEGKAAADVARLVLDAVGEKQKEVLLVPGFLPALAIYLRPLCPTLFFTLMARRAGKDKKES